MFSHLLKYGTKIYLNSRDGLIFAIILPLALGLVFLFAFEGLITDGSINPAHVAVSLEGSKEDKEEMMDFLASVGVEGKLTDEGLEPVRAVEDEDYLVYYLSDEEVADYLDQGKLNARVYLDQTGEDLEVSMAIPPNMANELTTYLAYGVFNTYHNTYNNVETNLTLLEDQAYAGRDLSFLEDFEDRLESGPDLDELVHKRSKQGVQSDTHYLLTALGYVCCHFFSVGIVIVRQNESYVGPVGKRLAVSPVSGLKRVAASFICLSIPSFLVVYLVLFAYWQRDVGLPTDYGKVILLISLVTLLSIFLGMVIAVYFKISEDIVMALSIIVAVGLSMIGGLMGQGSAMLKHWFADHAPIVNRLNPVTLVSDGLYQLIYYPTHEAFFDTIQFLLVYLLVLAVIIAIGLWRGNETCKS